MADREGGEQIQLVVEAVGEEEVDPANGDHDDDNEIGAVEPIIPVSLDDPRLMELTNEERQFALNIKEVVESLPDLDNLTDFMYCQLAIMEQNNVDEAIQRAYHLQSFRQEYGIQATRHDGLRCLRAKIDLFPRFILSFDYSQRDQHYLVILNFAGFSTRLLTSPAKQAAWLGGAYYVLKCLCPDFASIRRGGVLIAECEGYDWTKNGVHLESFRKFWSELATVYPIRFKKLRHFHNGLFFNLMFAMLKPILPAHIQSVFELGCQFDGRLDDVYLTPSVEHANQRLLLRLDEALTRRYRNEQSFSLS